MEANSKGTGATARRELMSSLNNEHWKALVIRELQADEWYAGAAALPEPPDLPDVKKVVTVETRPFGSSAHAGAELESIPMIVPVGGITNGHIASHTNGLSAK